jgi:hypothetical protein
VLAHLIAGGLGYSLRYVQERLKIRTHRRNIESLLGLTDRHVYVVHSAIFDTQRQAFNFPSCDARAARAVAHLLEKAGRVEGENFDVVSAEEFELLNGSIETGPAVDVIAICGPKRNAVVASVLAKAAALRYRLNVDTDGRSVLFDHEVGANIIGSNNVNVDGLVMMGPGIDFGVFQSMPNPFNHSQRVTILAGRRGAGTAGVAQMLADPSNIAEICKRRKGDTVEELVKTVWNETPERLSKVSLVR